MAANPPGESTPAPADASAAVSHATPPASIPASTAASSNAVLPSSPPSVPVPAVSSPEDELKKKLAALKDAQDGIAALNQTATSLQTDVKTLQAKLADVQQALAGYEKVSKALQQELASGTALMVQKRSIAAAVLKDQTTGIDAKISDFDKALAAQKDAVQKAADASQAAATDFKTADADAQQKQATYEQAKTSLKVAEASVKDVSGLMDQAAKAEGQSKYAAMYFLVREAKSISDQVKIASPDDYGKLLRTAQSDAEQSKALSLVKKAAADQSLSAYTGLKQQFESATKSRRSDLLALLAAPAAV